MAKVIGWRTKLDPPPLKRWLDVLNNSLQTPLTEQVELRLPSQGLPPIKIWKDKNPLGYARLTHARGKIAALSSEIEIPAENLITPELVRKICWELPDVEPSEYEKFVTSELSNLGARPWQITQVAPLIASALLEKEPLIISEPDPAEEADQPAGEPVQE
jgi:ribonuclease D